MAEARPVSRVSTSDCATSGRVSSRSERGGSGGEGRHARRQRIGNAKRIEAAKLLATALHTERSPECSRAHVLAGARAPPQFGDDLVERHRRRVDDARASGQ